MIITDLKATNFRKYTHLQLENLPDRGLVAVTGGNESGKSSIGDAIQFGLFGCTTQVTTGEVGKLIRWGEEQATVSLHMRHRGHAYHLIRSVNQAGDTVATLFSTEEGLTLADTPAAVAQQLKTLLGYNHKAFDQAFYWGQMSAQATQNGDMGQLLVLAGLNEHADLSKQLQNENRERIQAIAVLNAQRKETQANLAGMHIDEGRLPELQEIGAELEQRQQHFLQLAQRVDRDTESYPTRQTAFRQFQQHSQKVSFWTRIAILVFLLMLLTGVFLLFTPLLGSQLLAGMDEGLRELLGRSTVRVAAVAALLSAGLLVYAWYVDVFKLAPLRRQADRLAEGLMDGYEATNTPADQQMLGRTAQYLLETQTDIPLRSSDHADIAVLPEWAISVRGYELAMVNLQRAADAINISMESRSREFVRYLQSVQGDVTRQRELLGLREALNTDLDTQQTALEHIRRDRVVFDTAVDLLQRSGTHAVARFNQLVQQRCTALLQSFTNGRYAALELMPDFSIQVLSEQKGSYLDFAETSAGTQRQMALAMRVAVANALADNTRTTAQMLFLDEPLAFFDPERARNTLRSLQENTQSAVSQVWVTAQTLPEGVEFKKVIHCPFGESHLQA